MLGAAATSTLTLPCLTDHHVYHVTFLPADVCAAPAASLLSLANRTGMNHGLPGETLEYYLTCGADPTVQPEGAYKMVGARGAGVGKGCWFGGCTLLRCPVLLRLNLMPASRS